MRHGRFFLMSHSCTGVVGTKVGTKVRSIRCKPCDDLGKNEYLVKIIARYTHGIHQNALLVFHGVGGLIGVVRWKTLDNDALRLRHLKM